MGGTLRGPHSAHYIGAPENFLALTSDLTPSCPSFPLVHTCLATCSQPSTCVGSQRAARMVSASVGQGTRTPPTPLRACQLACSKRPGPGLAFLRLSSRRFSIPQVSTAVCTRRPTPAVRKQCHAPARCPLSQGRWPQAWLTRFHGFTGTWPHSSAHVVLVVAFELQLQVAARRRDTTWPLQSAPLHPPPHGQSHCHAPAAPTPAAAPGAKHHPWTPNVNRAQGGVGTGQTLPHALPVCIPFHVHLLLSTGVTFEKHMHESPWPVLLSD